MGKGYSRPNIYGGNTYYDERGKGFIMVFKKTISMLLCISILLSVLVLPVLAADQFIDITEDAWYHRAVQWAVSQEPAITNGIDGERFNPDAPCTRAQTVTMLWRWAGAVVLGVALTNVQKEYGILTGIVNGTSRDAFSPNDPCTRGQIVTMLWRMWSLFADTSSTVDNAFSDVPENTYYSDAVLWAVQEGITKGTSRKTFSPDLPCSRAQAVTFLYRLLGTFRYVNDPRDNASAMSDIVLDRDAVYGFRPSETGSLKQYSDADWTDEESVAQWRQARIEYHESLEELYDMIAEMQDEGKTTEEIAHAVSTRRNEIRMESYADDPEGLERLKARNLEQYGHEEGPMPEELFEKYGSWTMVIAKALSANSGMDACLGLYDTYFNLYVAIGQVEPQAEPEQEQAA